MSVYDCVCCILMMINVYILHRAQSKMQDITLLYLLETRSLVQFEVWGAVISQGNLEIPSPLPLH